MREIYGVVWATGQEEMARDLEWIVGPPLGFSPSIPQQYQYSVRLLAGEQCCNTAALNNFRSDDR